MQKKILVLDANKQQCRELCELLSKGSYSSIALNAIQDLENQLNRAEGLAVMLDIDTVAVDNRIIRELTIKFPETYFFCLSKYPFHPELEDAICYHIYACINRPIDPDELFYWLRSIEENEADPSVQPES